MYVFNIKCNCFKNSKKYIIIIFYLFTYSYIIIIQFTNQDQEDPQQDSLQLQCYLQQV